MAAAATSFAAALFVLLVLLAGFTPDDADAAAGGPEALFGCDIGECAKLAVCGLCTEDFSGTNVCSGKKRKTQSCELYYERP